MSILVVMYMYGNYLIWNLRNIESSAWVETSYANHLYFCCYFLRASCSFHAFKGKLSWECRNIREKSRMFVCVCLAVWNTVAVPFSSVGSNFPAYINDTAWMNPVPMLTSSNGKVFRVTGLLCGEFTGHRWISRTKTSNAELWCFLWSAPE